MLYPLRLARQLCIVNKTQGKSSLSANWARTKSFFVSFHFHLFQMFIEGDPSAIADFQGALYKR